MKTVSQFNQLGAIITIIFYVSAIVSILLFLVMAILAFVQRFVTGM